jgi:hypothetical protein
MMNTNAAQFLSINYIKWIYPGQSTCVQKDMDNQRLATLFIYLLKKRRSNQMARGVNPEKNYRQNILGLRISLQTHRAMPIPTV